MPLALSDAQMDAVRRAAAMIPSHDRDLFLRSVANRLAHIALPSDDEVRRAVNLVLTALGVSGLESKRASKERQVRDNFETHFNK